MAEETEPQHATLAPSAAHRWTRCPGSVALEARVPDETNVHAEEGTAAHELAETALRAGNDAAAYQGMMFNTTYNGGFEADEEMCRQVQKYINLVRDYAQHGELLVEQKVTMDRYVPSCWGTVDAVVLGDDGELMVIDLKYGRGVQVEAQGNEQLQLYGLGGYDAFSLVQDFEAVRYVIHQPRLDHLSEERATVEELEAFAAEAADKGHVALVNEPERNLYPGDKQCRFCRAKAICPAIKAEVERTVDESFDDLDSFADVQPPEAEGMPPEETAAVLNKANLIRDWLAAVEAHAQHELESGREVPGYKLVEGKRGSRQWVNSAEVENLLRNQFRLPKDTVYKRSLISPTDAEKLTKAGDIGKKRYQKLQEYVTQTEGKPKVVPASDKRPALDPAGAFEDLGDAETATQEQ